MPFRYVLFHKPFGVLTQFTAGATPPTDGSVRKTLADYLPIKDIYPVGRLDFDSEGLLLLTDDGVLQNRLSNPTFEHTRTYWAQVEGSISAEAVERLCGGLRIQDYLTRPCEANIISPPEVPERIPPIRSRLHIPTSWIELILTEGRNRQVRRMTAAVGFPTLRLLRVAVGALKLNGLAPGCWRDLTPQEVHSLRRLTQPMHRRRP